MDSPPVTMLLSCQHVHLAADTIVPHLEFVEAGMLVGGGDSGEDVTSREELGTKEEFRESEGMVVVGNMVTELLLG